jgi:hypothetical protein|tara:strand:+ start:77 stop:442 length:366 start_codon:yes stop_codon:yes gene_type:complete
MVRQIGNVLVFGLAILLLSSCAGAVKEITSYKIEKKREPLAIEDPSPLSLQDVDWIIITKENAAEVFEKIKNDKNGDYALFALTDTGYEKLALNFADIRNKLAEQRQIILSYKEYYEPKEE